MADRWARSSATVGDEAVPLYRSLEGALAQAFRRACALSSRVAAVWRCGTDKLWAIRSADEAMPSPWTLEARVSAERPVGLSETDKE